MDCFQSQKAGAAINRAIRAPAAIIPKSTVKTRAMIHEAD
jgi:hypothetical protein